MALGAEQQKLAVASGTWPLYRFDPRRAAEGEPLLQLDSPPPKADILAYMRNESRFRMVEKPGSRALQPAGRPGAACHPRAGGGVSLPGWHERPGARGSQGMTVDLSTTYLGLKLANPFLPGASPLCDHLDTVRRLEDAGAPALVMRSLFEEQIVGEQFEAYLHVERHGESSAEASSYLPRPQSFVFGPEEYLDHLRRVKEAVGIPVIASLNGVSRPRLERLPAAHPAGRRERAGAQPLPAGTRSGRQRRDGGGGIPPGDPRGPAAAHHPDGGQAVALLLLARLVRARGRGRGRGRAGAVQPLLPARHRPREPAGGGDAAPLEPPRVAVAPALAGGPLGASRL